MSKWFLQVGGRIKGPYTNESMQSALAQVSESQLQSSFFWKRGLTEWMRANKWRADIALQFATSETASQTQPAILKDPPTAKPAAAKDANSYRVQVNFVDQPVMNKTELLNFVAKQQDLTKLAIQNPQTKEWTDVYAFPDIVERLGISRRKNSRVPILAQFTGTAKGQMPLSAKIVTISEGGMGFTEVFNLQIGDQVEGQLASPHFFQPINIVADVIYSGLDGYIGLKFTDINDESKSAIIEYIKKFGKSQNHP